MYTRPKPSLEEIYFQLWSRQLMVQHTMCTDAYKKKMEFLMFFCVQFQGYCNSCSAIWGLEKQISVQ